MVNIIIGIASVAFFWWRSLHLLQYFQQDNYSSRRFISWLLKRRLYDKKASLVALMAAGTEILSGSSWLVALMGVSALLMVIIYQGDPRRRGKLPLKVTARAQRIRNVALWVYSLSVGCAAWLVPSSAWLWIMQVLFFQLAPLCPMIANVILGPWERRSQQKFIAEAKENLKRSNPYIIGITGSYGKTSTKQALGCILRTALGATFWPPQGVNTPMGITRELRENLKRYHEYAVIEMAAYQRGSIASLCRLTPPKAGLITNIGKAHLERFGDVDNIYATKSELAQAIPDNGVLVCNGDNEGSRRIAEEYRKETTLLYGFEHEQGLLDCWISWWEIRNDGTAFTIHWNDREYFGQTSLLGKPALSNLLGAFTMACALGCDPEYVIAVIKHLSAVDNRLQMVREGEVTYLRDAYNSNPIGFSAALDVMQALPAERRILMTPGMVEFGSDQQEAHEQLGRHAASVCDCVLLVGNTNRKALMHGLKEGNFDQQQLQLFETRDQALKALGAITKPGDIVLIENDLPDLYETKVTF